MSAIKLHPDHCTIIKLGFRVMRRGRVNPEVGDQIFAHLKELERGEITPSSLASSAVALARPKLPTPRMRWVAKNLQQTVAA